MAAAGFSLQLIYAGPAFLTMEIFSMKSKQPSFYSRMLEAVTFAKLSPAEIALLVTSISTFLLVLGVWALG